MKRRKKVNSEHLAILKTGKVENWNRWRKENPGITPDLSGAYLQGEFLQGANLRETDLRETDLQEADLREIDLQGAFLQRAILRETDLRGTNLQEANLREANLQSANLQEADLQGANLREADLRGANLREADLRGAYLQGANLQEAFLQGAILRGADFREAKFENTTYGKGVPISKEPIQIIGLRWFVMIFDEHMKIGCEFHSFDEWENFTDERIDKMHREALTFWKGNKKRLLDICKNR